MVKINKKEKYRCPYCNNNYVTYEEADKCAQACVVLQYEKPYKTSQYNTYVCKFCNTEYRIKINAQQCEKKHIKNEDVLYQDYKHHESIYILNQASQHPLQIKLDLFKNNNKLNCGD